MGRYYLPTSFLSHMTPVAITGPPDRRPAPHRALAGAGLPLRALSRRGEIAGATAIPRSRRRIGAGAAGRWRRPCRPSGRAREESAGRRLRPGQQGRHGKAGAGDGAGCRAPHPRLVARRPASRGLGLCGEQAGGRGGGPRGARARSGDDRPAARRLWPRRPGHAPDLPPAQGRAPGGAGAAWRPVLAHPCGRSGRSPGGASRGQRGPAGLDRAR